MQFLTVGQINSTMKLFKIIYFHIFNTYYRDGNYSNDIPILTASGVFGCCLSIILLSVLLFIGRVFVDFEPSKESVIVALVLLIAFFYWILMSKKRSYKIYQQVKNTKWDKPIFKILSWLIMPFAVMIAALYAYMFN